MTFRRPRLRLAVYAAVLVLQALHPILHATGLEGGALDALLPQLHAWLALDSSVPGRE